MVNLNPPVLPAILPQLPKHNQLRSLHIMSGLGGWEDFPHSTARPHIRRARVREYVSILPYSQREKGIKRYKGLGAAVVWEGGLGRGRIA